MTPGYTLILKSNYDYSEKNYPINSDEQELLWIAKWKNHKGRHIEVYLIKFTFKDFGEKPGWHSELIYSNQN